MEKLLQWAVDNSNKNSLSEQAEAIRKGEAKIDPSKYDPRILEAILGPDDATRMKDAVACISNPEETVENKEIALDNLELLIEGIDNACNLENMKLWPAVIEQLSAKEPQVRKGTAWVCGTAVQNNPKAQKAFLSHGGLEPLLRLLDTDQDNEVRSKALYAISGLLKHNAEALAAFEPLDGFNVLRRILHHENPTMVRKVIFLYNSLMIDNESLAARLVHDHTLEDLEGILKTYTTERDDEDMVEKTLRTIHTMIQKSQKTPSDELRKTCQAAKDKYGADNLNLVESEWKDLL
ncbi:Fes1-domain-containing protein [Rhizopus microsporus ATCC 52813]|uniref:Fes1-domain-containing protein n=2 Tax=Rhizopus microsporus TaxID=58291 RepID=A0A2G4SQT7_RHIZD|nr:Fes1-domain-containing protein [Rhizopus microsporus ATCC 52813]PHZ11115.1 Fes1-domain-containing protein [Rhizopus microsporus ATCC 52813]